MYVLVRGIGWINFFFFQAEDGIRDIGVTGVQTCALPICQVLAPRIDTVQAGSAAEAAGFRPDDLVVSIDGRSIASFADMQRLVSTSAGDKIGRASCRERV